MDNYIGKLLDERYELLSVIGTGGMAVVYKARCHRLNRMVAIKVLKDEYSQDAEFRRRFHAESQAVAMLNHPNIVNVYDVSTNGDADYIVMELVEGITLKQYMERRGGYLNWKESLHFAMQIAKALEHAHSQGVVHRDIKPHNVMILKNGTAKVTDFGIARMMTSQSTLTKETLGSVHYISPEQAKGGRVDNRSDIYSLGVVMYEMLTGQPPYDADAPVTVALMHLNGGAALPSTLNPNIPGGLEQIIMKAMAKEPDDRYATCTEMLYEMEEFRKNPNILFYHEHRSQAQTTGGQQPPARQQPQQPRTTAERVAAGSGPAVRPAPRQEQPRPARQQPRPAQQQSRARATEPEYEQGGRSKGLIIAMAVIALLAVIGIAVLVILLGGGDDPVMVQVPNFVGEVFNDINRDLYPNLVLKDEEYQFSDKFEAGEIISQDPDARQMVEEGTEVRFVISNGPQTGLMLDLVNRPEDKAREALNGLKDLRLTIVLDEEFSTEIEEGRVVRTEPEADATLSVGQTVTLWVSKGPRTMTMEDLTGEPLSNAEAILENLEGMNLKTEVKEESSEEIEEGKVTRTEPAKGKEIKAGQTVTIYVSTGSAIVKTRVPAVTGMDISKAVSLLDSKNLDYDYDRVDSDAPKDEVLTQSIEKGTEVPEGTVILLTVSNGPKQTEPPTEETKPQTVNKTVTLVLPDGIAAAYSIQVYKDNAPYTDALVVEPGTVEVPISLEGSGTVYFDFYVNGIYADSFRVDFTDDTAQRILLEFTVEE